MKLLTRLFALVILTLLPVAGIAVYDEFDARSLRAEAARDQALKLVRLVAQEQSRIFEGAQQLLTALGKTPLVRSGDPASCKAFLADLTHSYPQYLDLVSVDLTGRAVCAGGVTEPMGPLGDRPFFKRAIAERGFALAEYEGLDTARQKAIYLAQPCYDAAGRVDGVVAARLSLDWLSGEIARNPLPPKATVYVIDRQGSIVVRYPEVGQFVDTKVPRLIHSYFLTGAEGVQEAPGFDGVPRIYAYAPLPGGLTLSVGLDKEGLFKGYEAANRRDLLAIAGSCILALILATIGARLFIARPVRVLLDAAERWAGGDLGARIRLPEVRSEFGRLGAAFNAMAGAIGVREQDLERRVKERTEAQLGAEAALYESRRMETVGRLTGGVAHDFNNLLAAIVGNIELARARLHPRHPGLSRLDAAMQSANRGAALVQQLLTFARRQHLRPEVVELNSHIRGHRDILRRNLRSCVTIDFRLSAETWRVRVDPKQLEAAILNLVINARDAMPTGGTLRLETKNVTLTPHPHLADLTGDFVALTVSDTGTGIRPEILEKVFEPFFTTKDVGAGSGMGLSMVQGFVRQSSGFVAIESIVGQGTAVTLYLARTTDAVKPVGTELEQTVAEHSKVRSVTADLL
jgi:signal transduction histidine kinase